MSRPTEPRPIRVLVEVPRARVADLLEAGWSLRRIRQWARDESQALLEAGLDDLLYQEAQDQD